VYGEPHGAHYYAPDGLAGEVLDELIDRAYAEVANAPGPTSALLNGSAAEQRRRRMERRALAVLTRVLRMHGSALDAGGRWVA
jgi:hypothetical protein